MTGQTTKPPAPPHPPGSTEKFRLADAIREHVMVDLKRALDRDGKNDVISVDIVRPRTSGRVPVIMEESPYYDGAGRGSLSQKKIRNAAGVVVGMPLFYDNYFVPRGYAFAAMDAPGQGRSTGCGDLYGPDDRAAVSAVLDWLDGSRSATSDAGKPVSAFWSSGRVGMIGKSADGADALSAAATGHPALKTVVSIEGLVDLYPAHCHRCRHPVRLHSPGGRDPAQLQSGL